MARLLLFIVGITQFLHEEWKVAAFTAPTQPTRQGWELLSSTKESSQQQQQRQRQRQRQQQQQQQQRKGPQRSSSPKYITLGEMGKKLANQPAEPLDRKKKYRRSRQRVERPKQQYLYKSQRERLEKEGKLPTKKAVEVDPSRNPLAQAKEFGMIAASQHCDVLVDDVDPTIVGRIRVSDKEGSGTYAYVIEKPAGWSILGGSGAAASKQDVKTDEPTTTTMGATTKKKTQTVAKKHVFHVPEKDGSIDRFEIDESDILALMTPEEIEDFYEAASDEPDDVSSFVKTVSVSAEEADNFGIDESDILALMTPEEIEEYRADQSIPVEKPVQATAIPNEDLDPTTVENLRRISLRKQSKSSRAEFNPSTRPSLVNWLKDMKRMEGTPIRGGNFWKALAGATGVDDSGLVVLSPKESASNVFVEFTQYTAVLGTSGDLAPKSKVQSTSKAMEESMSMETLSRLRKGRIEDTVHTVRVTVPDGQSTCAQIVDPLQTKFQDGIRGDPAANPLDRRARRRLLHCNALSVSSLVCDDTISHTLAELPDDMAILADRQYETFLAGRFRGRSSCMANPFTTCYREVNGLADGFPGWTVDRYDKWLFVQHDPQYPKGPLPSIHDGRTAGVYYMEARQDRSAMGSRGGSRARPYLYEGQPLKTDTLTVEENGVKYAVSLDRDLSTGIFLDQRPQRAWLAQNCNEKTSLLNCFAHTGAFSVAAAKAGASTVSLDLSQKWLDRLPEHFAANDMVMDERHDRIYGDCFDWLARLARRGENYDIVILDPPSSSVGSKKKRWSVKNDMAELVALAARLVKRNGLLWTTTNSANLSHLKFARMCRQGLDEAGRETAKLERVQPMPSDFPTIGTQPVKNLVWRLP